MSLFSAMLGTLCSEALHAQNRLGQALSHIKAACVKAGPPGREKTPTYKPRSEASGETSPAHNWILDFQLPDCEAIISVI